MLWGRAVSAGVNVIFGPARQAPLAALCRSATREKQIALA
jgi:hypothetical protein